MRSAGYAFLGEALNEPRRQDAGRGEEGSSDFSMDGKIVSGCPRNVYPVILMTLERR